MCGFVGFLGGIGLEYNAGNTLLKKMTFPISRRGPDNEGYWYDPDARIGLGHRRLSIIDLSQAGRQPMHSPSGRFVIAFNGEIYNYLELRDELQREGVEFKTDSDTEVLLGILMQYGEKALTKLNGMFAFVFHDRKQNQWIVARDPFGIKPLYYIQVGDQLIFASEIKAILAHPDVPARRNDKALHQYLAFQLSLDDQTLFGGINKVMPGHYFLGVGHEIKQKKCLLGYNIRDKFKPQRRLFA